MANRHANKKLRAAVLARMALTGESYQTARRRVLLALQERCTNQRPTPASSSPHQPSAELVEVQILGRPLVLGMIAFPGLSSAVTFVAGLDPPREALVQRALAVRGCWPFVAFPRRWGACAK